MAIKKAKNESWVKEDGKTKLGGNLNERSLIYVF